MSNDEKWVVASRIGMADQVMADARIMLDAGVSGRSLVNRLYYAAFYALLGLLMTIGKAPTRHKGALR